MKRKDLKANVLFVITYSPPYLTACARYFLILLFCIRQNNFLKVFMCYVLKKNDSLLHFSMLSFFLPGCFDQFSTSNCCPVFNFLQFHIVLWTSFWQFIKKFDTFSSAFRCSYDIESTVNYSSSGRQNVNQVHPPIHKTIPTFCYLKLKRRFLAYKFFVKF